MSKTLIFSIMAQRSQPESVFIPRSKSVCLSIRPSVRPFVCLFVSLSACLPVCFSVLCLLVCLSLSVFKSFCLSVSPLLHFSVPNTLSQRVPTSICPSLLTPPPPSTLFCYFCPLLFSLLFSFPVYIYDRVCTQLSLSLSLSLSVRARARVCVCVSVCV